MNNHAKGEYGYMKDNDGLEDEITDDDKWFNSVHTLIMDRFFKTK